MGLLDQFKAYIDANTPRNTRPAVSPQNVIYAGLLQKPVENIKANAAGLLGEMQRAPQDLAALASPQMYAKALKAMNTPQPVDKQKWIDAGMELSGMAPVGGLLAHTVYHGSPHKFTKFDMSKIGTGEGAQAYGHGLYFAENPSVAQEYQNSVGRNLDQLIDIAKSKGMSHETASDLAQAFQSGKRFDDYVYAAKDTLDSPLASEAQQAAARKLLNEEWPAYEAYSAFKEPGQFYKVDIPDEAIPRMLDWDKPLSEQPEGVRVAVQDLGLPANATGKDAYNALANLARDGAIARGNNAATTLGGSQSAASVDLQGYGIPGIRYLDGSSRNAGQGTSNFVLFDGQLPRILEVNGQPTGLLSWADEAKKAKKK